MRKRVLCYELGPSGLRQISYVPLFDQLGSRRRCHSLPLLSPFPPLLSVMYQKVTTRRGESKKSFSTSLSPALPLPLAFLACLSQPSAQVYETQGLNHADRCIPIISPQAKTPICTLPAERRFESSWVCNGILSAVSPVKGRRRGKPLEIFRARVVLARHEAKNRREILPFFPH